MSNARKFKAALGASTAAVLSLGVLTALPASADYAPGAGDVVGVGSDTVQYAMDFIADGDNLGDGGYNTLGNLNKIINFDATPDANARLAYGPGGATGPCNNGTGSGAGTGQAGTSAGSAPCILNPTIVTRAGDNPVQRPNGSGAGRNAILADHGSVNTPAGYQSYTPEINYVRASSAASSTQETTAGTQFGTNGNSNGGGLDSVTLGHDLLAMLASNNASGGVATHAVALSVAQLKHIYNCDAGYTNWSASGVGGSSADTIIPVIPQVGSGTRSSFLSDIGLGAPGSCVKTSEENDPTAIYANWSAGTVSGATATSGSTTITVPSGTVINVGDIVTGTGIASGTAVTAVSGTSVTISAATTAAVTGAFFKTNPADVISPMSGGRLNLWQGNLGTGGATGAGGYFLDPTNAWNTQAGADVTANILKPDVAYTTGTPSDAGALYQDNRNLYVYWRSVDVNSSAIWQPGGTLNWVRTIFYNPCLGAGHTTGCSTVGSNQFGPGGAPFLATSGGQALIAAAGINPTYTINLGA